MRPDTHLIVDLARARQFADNPREPRYLRTIARRRHERLLLRLASDASPEVLRDTAAAAERLAGYWGRR